MALSAQDFSVLEELHRSTGGTVYLGRRISTGERVVLKERIKPEMGRGRDVAHELELYERLGRAHAVRRRQLRGVRRKRRVRAVRGRHLPRNARGYGVRGVRRRPLLPAGHLGTAALRAGALLERD